MDLNTQIIAGAALMVIGILIFQFRGSAVTKAFKVARTTHDVKPLVAAIDAKANIDVPTTYNSYIKALWDAYDRETATELIHALLERNDTAPISQFWLRTVLEVEPELARKQLGESFIKAHFKEAIAAACGGCGGSCKSCKSCK